MKTQLIIPFLFFFSVFNALSQDPDSTEIQKVEQVVNDFFKGLESGDTALISSIFHPETRLITTSLDGDKENRIDLVNSSEFLQAVGSPRDGKWEERVSNMRVSIDQGLANVWMDYTFYYNGNLSHCGVNSFEIMKEGDKWIILGISDSRRLKNCEQ